MEDEPIVYSIILAAGKGARAGRTIPKQYIEICGKPVLWWCLKAHAAASEVGRICLVVNEADWSKHGFSVEEIGREVILIPGGEARENSVEAGLSAGRSEEFVVIQNGANPLVTSMDIDNCIRAAKISGAATAYLPCDYTVFEYADSEIVEVKGRSNLGQTRDPQVFRYDAIVDAYRRKDALGVHAITNDVVVMRAAGHRVTLVKTDESNFKVTRYNDILIAEELLRRRLSP